MNGKSYSIPIGMVFKKFYCPDCGARLTKERTHRVVTKEDKDYYIYHDAGTFPLCDYDVYSYEFKCPECGKRNTYREQCIIGKIQKKLNKKVLSTSEIKEHYDSSKRDVDRTAHIVNIFSPTLFALVFFTIYFAVKGNITRGDWIFCLVSFAIIIVSSILNEARRISGKSRTRHKQIYSYAEEELLKQLHTYSKNNRELISRSSRCYCFFCKKEIDPEQIEGYVDNTALCPHCRIDAVIPDGIEFEINEDTVNKMNEYWF